MRKSALFFAGAILTVGLPVAAFAGTQTTFGEAAPVAAKGIVVAQQSTGGNQGTDVPGPGGGPIAKGTNAQGNYGAQSTGGNQGTDVPGPGGGPIAKGKDAQGNFGSQSTGGNQATDVPGPGGKK